MLASDRPLVWAGHDRVRQVLEEGTPEADIPDEIFQPARAVSEDVVGDIYVQDGGDWLGDPGWRFCVITDAGTVYGFDYLAAWQPPSE
jgi:hypothetical protein